MVTLLYIWHITMIPVRYHQPYGFELGSVAAAIASGRGFSSPLRFVQTGPTIWFTPIYPYLAAGVFKIWGVYSEASKLILETLNCVFAALTIIPIYAVALKCFGKKVAAGAAWAWVFLPTALFFPIFWIWDTTLAALFMALIFWATLEIIETKSVWAWAGYGALWVTGVMVNPSVLSLFPFLAGWALWRSRDRSSSWLKYSAATLLLFTIGFVPWTIRNYRVFGKFIALRSNFGLELWLGNNPNVPDTWSPMSHPNDDRAEAEKYARMGEIAYMADKEREAFRFMRAHPGDTAYFMFRRFVENWLAVTDTPTDVWSHSPPHIRAFLVLNVLLSLLTLLGAMFVYRARHAAAFPFTMVPLIFALVFYLTHSSLRYRFPMDPIMMVLAAYGVGYLVSTARGRILQTREAASPAPSFPAS